MGGTARALLALLLLTTLSCAARQDAGAGTDEGLPAPLSPEEALQAAALLQVEAPHQVLRYNPAPEACGCPRFEVRIGERWWRVRIYLRALTEEDYDAALARYAERLAAGDVRHIYATGDLDDEVPVVCPNGSYGVEMRVDGLFDRPPPPPAEE